MAGEQAAVRIKIEKACEESWLIRADVRVGGEVCTQLQMRAEAL